MTLGDCLRVLRARWRIIVAVAVLGVVVAALIAILMPRSYGAKVDVFFTASDPTTNVADRVGGYAPLVTNEFVTSSVIGQLRLPETPHQFAQHVTVTSTPGSAVLTATVTLADPAQASAAANAVASSFIDLFGRLEAPPAPNTLPAVTARLVQPAGPPAAATWPSVLTLVVGLAVGLVLGAAAAGLRHALDPKVRSRDELERLTGRPCLAEIRTPVGDIGRAPTASRAEFRQLRAVLRRLDVNGPPWTFAVSAATAVTSTRAVSVGLASAFARARDAVLLVEADLHAPQIARHPRPDRRSGLTEVLGGTTSLDQAVRYDGGAGLWMLPAGPVKGDPGDLLGSPRMAELLSETRRTYDVVVIDTAPLLEEPGAAELASNTDGVVLLVGVGSTRKKAVREAVELLGRVGTPVLGTVLTHGSGSRGSEEALEGPPGSEVPAAAAGPDQTPSPGPSTVPSPPVVPSPRVRGSSPSSSSAPVEGQTTSGVTAETPDRSLVSLRSTARGDGAGSTGTEGPDETTRTDHHDEREARGDPGRPDENGPE